MKANMKIFKTLTRTPDIMQNVLGKSFNIYFATDKELKEHLVGDITSILSTDGKEYRLLIEKDAYEYKSCKLYYQEKINEFRVELIEKVSKLQKISLFGVILPLASILLIVVTLILVFNKKWFGSNSQSATWLIGSLMVFLFSVSFTTNKTIKSKVFDYQNVMEEKTVSYLGRDTVNTLSKDLEEYAKEKYAKHLGNAVPTVKENEEENKEELNSNNQDEKQLDEEIENTKEEVENTNDIANETIEKNEPKEKLSLTINRKDLNNKTVSELKGIAKSLNLKGYSTLKKKELIELILKD